MVQIKVTAVNQAYTVTCAYDDFSSFLTMLKERLKACADSHSGHFEAFFHMQNELSAQELLDVMKCANEVGTIVLGFHQEKEKRELIVVEENLFSGQMYEFDQEVLLLGSIGAEAFVTSSESMYCIGTIGGNIDLMHEDCVICASGFFQANIRICDTHYQNMTSFSPAQVYYKERKLYLKELKEEKAWDVQSR